MVTINYLENSNKTKTATICIKKGVLNSLDAAEFNNVLKHLEAEIKIVQLYIAEINIVSSSVIGMIIKANQSLKKKNIKFSAINTSKKN